MIELEDLLAIDQCGEAFREFEEERREEAYYSLTEWRRYHSNFMERPVASVFAPRCEDCYSYKARGGHWEPPDIIARSWQEDLRHFGMTIYDVEEAGGASLRCPICHSDLQYAKDNFYVDSVPFDLYFANELLQPPRGRKAPKWMRRAIFDAYEGHCFGCGAKLDWADKENVRVDHIQPFRKCRETDLFNLQLLCKGCDQSKGDKQPRQPTAILTIHSPLFGN